MSQKVRLTVGSSALIGVLLSSCGTGLELSGPEAPEQRVSQAQAGSESGTAVDPPTVLPVGEYFCVTSLVTDDIPPPQLAFLLHEGGRWTDITIPSRPLEGRYEYADGEATFYDAEESPLYYFRWNINSSGREQLQQLIPQDVHTGVFCYRKNDGWTPPTSLGRSNQSSNQEQATLGDRPLPDLLAEVPGREQLDGEEALTTFAEIAAKDAALGLVFDLPAAAAECLLPHGDVAVRAYVTPDRDIASGMLIASNQALQDDPTIAETCLEERVVATGDAWAPCADRYFVDSVDDARSNYFALVVGTHATECSDLRAWHKDLPPHDF